MERRTFMQPAAAAALPLPSLAAPSVGDPSRHRTLIFVPQTSLASLDPRMRPTA